MTSINDLPADGDILQEIIRRIPCEASRHRLPEVCRDWRNFGALELPPRLPWLLCPVAGGPDLCCLLCGDRANSMAMVHRLRRVRDEATGARCFGSYEGRYLFVAHGGRRGNILLNLRTGERHVLPDQAVLRGASHDVVMVAATLSSAPEEDGCVGAAIVMYDAPGAPKQRRLVIWLKGRMLASDPYTGFHGILQSMEVEDVIHYKDAFYFLTSAENVCAVKPTLLPNGELNLEDGGVFYFSPENIYARKVQSRYLVECQGELLMVVKLISDTEPYSDCFKVFQRKLPKTHLRNQPIVFCTWTEIERLNGHILFIGRGCSRAYDLASFPMFKDGIYFLDDTNSDGHEPLFPCTDSGKWTGAPPIVQHCFEKHLVDSGYSAPSWILP